MKPKLESPTWMKDAGEYELEANDRFEGFLESIRGDIRFTRPIEEDDFVDEDWSFVYTDRAMRLIENIRRRLHKVGHRLFPDELFTIESHLYQEL